MHRHTQTDRERQKEMDGESFNKMTHTDLVSLGGGLLSRKRKRGWRG
jgi:hypothetical protein